MTLQASESKTRVVLFEFEYGRSLDLGTASTSFLRVTSAFRPFTHAGYRYLSEPLVGYEEEFQSGSVEDKSFNLFLPLSCDNQETQKLVDALAAPAPFSPVRVRVFEVLDTVEVAHLAEGEVSSSHANPEEMVGFLKLEVIPSKSNLTGISLGMPANPQCVLTYGGPGCGISTDYYYDAGTYFPNHFSGGLPVIRRALVELRTAYPGSDRSSVVDIRISSTQHPSASQLTLTTVPRGWWINGYLEREGIIIPIRDWWWNVLLSQGSNFFVLGKIPPKDWFYDPLKDNFLSLVPGCTKSPTACAQRNNINNWAGYGYSIPAYNPLYDEPS